MSNELVHVTKTYMPSKEKYQKHVDDIFESAWITNNGSKVQELEKRLANYLGIKNIVLNLLGKDIKSKIKNFIYTDKNIPKLSSPDREALSIYFRSDIDKLEKLLDKDLSNWKKI